MPDSSKDSNEDLSGPLPVGGPGDGFDDETIAHQPSSGEAASSSRLSEKGIFLAAAEIEDASERDAFLDEACGDDAPLRKRMQALFQVGAATDFLEPGETVKNLKLSRDNRSGEKEMVSENYRVGEEIARGGMGSIRVAEDSKLKRSVAIKVMHWDQAASPAVQARFLLEAEVLAELAHPNIVPIHDIVREDGKPLFYSMKLVKGRTLQAILNDLRDEKSDTLEEYTLDRLLLVFRKVCDAMAFAHSRDIIHRDLKPENIMVGEFGEVLVMDWGLAKKLGETAVAEVDEAIDPESTHFAATLQGDVMGTPKYMSPEQASGEIDQLDHQSDIFSLGGILYAILTLRPPVEGTTLQEILEKVKTADVREPLKVTTANDRAGTGKETGEVLEAKQIKPLPHTSTGRVPPALSSVVMKALKRVKSQRYSSVADLSADIESYQGGFATEAEQAGLGKQLALMIKRNRGVFATGAAAWLLITVLAVWFVLGLRNSEKETRRALAKSQMILAEKEFESENVVESRRIVADIPDEFRDSNWVFLKSNFEGFTFHFGEIPMVGNETAKRLAYLPQKNLVAAKRWMAPWSQIFLYEVSTGKEIRRFTRSRDDMRSRFAVDRSENLIAFSVSPSEVTIEEVSSGKSRARWETGITTIEHVTISPGGDIVIVSGSDQVVAFDSTTQAVLWERPYFKVEPSFSPMEPWVAVVSERTNTSLEIELVKARSGEVVRSIRTELNNSDKSHLEFSDSGHRLAALGLGEAILWDPRSGERLKALPTPGERVLRLSPKADSIATISGSRIRLRGTGNGRVLRSLDGGMTEPADVVFGGEDGLVISAHNQGGAGVVVWPYRLEESVFSGHSGLFRGRRVAFHPDGTRLFSSGASTAYGWDVQTGEKVWEADDREGTTSPRGGVADIGIHPGDGTMLHYLIGDQHFQRVDAEGSKREPWGEARFTSIRFHESGRYVLGVDVAFDGLESGEAIRVLEYPSGKVLRYMSTKDERQPFAVFCEEPIIATAAFAGGITFWNWQTGEKIHHIEADDTGSIGCLASSPDGKWVASAGPDRFVRIWNSKTGELRSAFRAHWDEIVAIEFTRDGKEVITGARDGRIRLHAVGTGEETLVLFGQTSPIADLDVSPDGTLLAAIAENGTTKVWDLSRSRQAALLPAGLAPFTEAPPIDEESRENETETTLEPNHSPSWRTKLAESGITPQIVHSHDDGTVRINLSHSPLRDLSALSGVPVSHLDIGRTEVSDLTPLIGAPLRVLAAYNTKIVDLGPLTGMPLEELSLGGSEITDLEPLRGAPIRILSLNGGREGVDLSPLADCHELVELGLPPKPKNLERLRNLPNLERISYTADPDNGYRPDMTAEEFWKRFDE